MNYFLVFIKLKKGGFMKQFLRSSLISVITILFAITIAIANEEEAKFPKRHYGAIIEGQNVFIIKNGEKYLLRGVSISALEQGINMDLNDIENYAKYDNDHEKIDEALIVRAKEIGVNCVRIPFNISMLVSSVQFTETGEPDKYTLNDKYKTEILDAVDLAKKNDLKVILEMHNTLYYVSNYGEAKECGININKNSNYHNFLGYVWKDIAEEINKKENENKYDNVIGFEPVNEPFDLTIDTQSNWLTIAQNIINEIRTVDKERLIFIDGRNSSSASGWVENSGDLKKLKDNYNRLVFAPHLFFEYIDKRTKKYLPEKWVSELFEKHVIPVIKWSKDNKLPIVFTSFGFLKDKSFLEPLMNELLHEYFDFYGIGAIIWAISQETTQSNEVTGYIKSLFKEHTNIIWNDNNDGFLFKENFPYKVELNNWGDLFGDENASYTFNIGNWVENFASIEEDNSIKLTFDNNKSNFGVDLKFCDKKQGEGIINHYDKISFNYIGDQDLKIWIDDNQKSNLIPSENSSIKLSDYISLNNSIEYLEIPITKLYNNTNHDTLYKLKIQAESDLYTGTATITNFQLVGNFMSLSETAGISDTSGFELNFNSPIIGTNLILRNKDNNDKYSISCDSMKNSYLSFDYRVDDSSSGKKELHLCLEQHDGKCSQFFFQNTFTNYTHYEIPFSETPFSETNCPDGSSFNTIRIQQDRIDDKGIAYLDNLRIKTKTPESSNKLQIKMENKSYQNPTSITLPVSVENDDYTAIKNINYSITYDSTVLSYTNITFSENQSLSNYFYEVLNTENSISINIHYNNYTPVALSGTIFNLNFEVETQSLADSETVLSITGNAVLNKNEYTPTCIVTFDNKPPEPPVFKEYKKYTNNEVLKWSWEDDENSKEYNITCLSGNEFLTSFITSTEYTQTAKNETSYTVCIKAKDKAGNWSKKSCSMISYDITPPEQSFNFECFKDYNIKDNIENCSVFNTICPDDEVYAQSSNVSITYTSSDSFSGIKDCSFSNNNNIYTSYQSLSLNSYSVDDEECENNCEKTVYMKCEDKAGNVSEPYTSTIIIGQNPPIVDFLVKKYYTRPSENENYVEIDYIINNNYNEIIGSDAFEVEISYYIKDVSQTKEDLFKRNSSNKIYRFVPDIGNGLYTLNPTSIYGACSEAKSNTYTFIYDTTDPIVEILPSTPETITLSTRNLSIKYTCVDETSGITSITLLMNTPDGYTELQQSIQTAPGIEYTGLFQYTASTAGEYRYTIKATDKSGNSKSGNQYTTTNITDINGYAIIVSGTDSNDQNREYSFYLTAKNVYSHFVNHNFTYRKYIKTDNRYSDPKDLIKFIVPEDIKDNYDDECIDKDNISFESAINSWAVKKIKDVPAPLYIVLIGHGDENTFDSNGVNITNIMLKDMINDSNLSKDQPVILITGACSGGQYLSDISESITNSILISSTKGLESDKIDLKLNDKNLSGNFFITELFYSLGQEESIQYAFNKAQKETEVFYNNKQHPQMICNGIADPYKINLGAMIDNANLSNVEINFSDTQYLSFKEEKLTFTLTNSDASNITAWLRINELNNTDNPKYEDLKNSFTLEKSFGCTNISCFIHDNDQDIIYMKDSWNINRNYEGNNSPPSPTLSAVVNNKNEIIVFDGKINFYWSDSIDPDGHNVKYLFELFDDEERIFYEENIYYANYSYDFYYVALKDINPELSSSKTYTCTVKAIDEYGLVNTSNIVSFKYPGGSPVDDSFILVIKDTWDHDIITNASIELPGKVCNGDCIITDKHYSNNRITLSVTADNYVKIKDKTFEFENIDTDIFIYTEPIFVTEEDKPITFYSNDLSGYELSEFPLNLTLVSIDNISISGNSITIKPNENQSGDLYITLTNDEDDKYEKSFLLKIEPVNDPPKISYIENQTISEDTETKPISFTISDVDGDSLTLSASSSNISLVTHENIEITETGEQRTIIIVPESNMFGSTIITIGVSDGIAVTQTRSFELGVTSVNDPPKISFIENQTISEDTETKPISFTISDPDGDLLTLSPSSSNISLVTLENIEITGTGEQRILKIVPENNMFGSTTITIGVSDGIAITQTRSFELAVILRGDLNHDNRLSLHDLILLLNILTQMKGE